MDSTNTTIIEHDPRALRNDCLQSLAKLRLHAQTLATVHDGIAAKLLEQLAEFKLRVAEADHAREAWEDVQRQVEQAEATLAREHGEGHLNHALMRVQLAAATHRLAIEALELAQYRQAGDTCARSFDASAAPIIEMERRAVQGLQAAEEDLKQLVETDIDPAELRAKVDHILRAVGSYLGDNEEVSHG
jgi:uncharacterized membrane protein